MTYPSNLCDLSAEEQHDIEVDRQRWWLATRLHRTRKPHQINHWLGKVKDKAQQKDMTKRLNQLEQQGFNR